MHTIVSRAALALALTGSTMALGACSVSIGSKTVNAGNAQKFLVKNIRGAASADCPKDITPKKGGTFDCKVTLKSGKSEMVTLHMTNNSGGVHVSNADIH